jgi:hypothetical protein
MNNYTTNTYEIKRFFKNNLHIFCDNNQFNFRQRKTLYDFSYGIAKSKSLMLSEIARALNEDVLINSTITRLDRNINDSNLTVDLFSRGYVNIVKSLLNEDNNITIIVDDSDITKKHSYKLEDLDYVRDGSANGNKWEKGYWLTQMVAITAKKQPVTIASKIYSTKTKGFKSKNDVLHEMIKKVVEIYGEKITFVFDRGFDDLKLFSLLNDLGVSFIVRVKDNRKFKYQSKTVNSLRLKEMCKGKVSCEFNSSDEVIPLKLSHLKVRLPSNVKIDTKTVVVKGFGKNPMVLLTNQQIKRKDDVLNVLWNYIKRWKIEEMFRFHKEEFGLENIRVRTIDAMEKLINILHLLSTIYVKIKENDRSLLLNKILKRAKVLTKKNDKKVSFYLYRIAKGIAEILSKSHTSLDGLLTRYRREKYKQLKLDLF